MTEATTAPARTEDRTAAPWLPSLPAIIFAVLAFGIAVALPRRLVNSDGDLARHIAHGRWMIEHGQLIHADPFSYTRPGEPFTGFEYGSQLILAAADAIGGLPAIVVLAALMISTAYTLLLVFLLRKGVDPLLAVAALVSSIFVGMMYWLARPHLVTTLATVVLLSLIAAPRRISPAWFIPLFAIWANLHGGFLYGLAVIGLFVAGSALTAGALQPSMRGPALRELRYYMVSLAAALGGTLLTPHGPTLYQHLKAVFGNEYALSTTAEFTSPDFHDFWPRLFLVVVLVWLGGALMAGRRLRPVTLLMTLAGIWLALGAQRHMPLFGLTAIPLLALHLDSSWREIALVSRLRNAFAAGAAIGSTTPWVAAATLVLCALGLSGGRLGQAQILPRSFDRETFPVTAFDSLEKADIGGRLFTEFTWGGYLLYAWPDQKVFIDGGTDFYGDEIMRQFITLKSIRPGWRELLERWDIGLVVLKPSTPLAAELLTSSEWQIAYRDSVAVALIPADPGR